MNQRVADIAAIHQGNQASALCDSCHDYPRCRIFPFQVVCFQVGYQACCSACYQDRVPV
jgi:hypothetical protein